MNVRRLTRRQLSQFCAESISICDLQSLRLLKESQNGVGEIGVSPGRCNIGYDLSLLRKAFLTGRDV